MPKLRIPEAKLILELTDAIALRDVCEQHTTDLPFGCFSARCGACRIRVLENPSGLSETTEMERELLSTLSAHPDKRLACQCVVQGDVTIEVIRQKWNSPKLERHFRC